MKENVVQELQQMQPDEQTKHKMLEILKRFHSEEEMDSVDEDCKSSIFLLCFQMLQSCFTALLFDIHLCM